jgi:anti-anti-sigma regulatory factor
MLRRMTVRLRVPAVDDPQFVADYDERARVLKLIGSADNTTAAALGRLFADLHLDLSGKKAPQVVVDMRDLDFLGTACAKELVAWFEKLESAADRYAIKLRSNPSIAWQRTTLPALACFDPTLVTVET